MLNNKLTAILIAFLFCCSPDVNADNRYPLIPYPSYLEEGVGSFTITAFTSVVAPAQFRNEAAILRGYLATGVGKGKQKAGTASITLLYDASVENIEGYHLNISSRRVTLSARSATGMFRGVQTLRQLLPAAIESPGNVSVESIALPALTIRDSPAFAWRGMHLDVSRHFFSLAYLRKFIDLMALYKLNKFHLHLTDDQGWRIEIKKYPKLTSEGAWRTFNNHDSACMVKAKENPDFNIDPAHIKVRDGKTVYGGFYTQKELKELVTYATAKHIEIIPEIDMPGHMMAAINSYGYLSCNGKSVFGEWFTTPICPCIETTYQFAQNVFREIMDIFPSRYIHIGGDEVDRIWWEKSAACKTLMADSGMKTTAELQSYFIRRMEKFFNARGKKLIGWDEIIEGGVSKTAVIMYWRTWKPDAPSLAAKAGNEVIMTPVSPLYFSSEQDKSSLKNVYSYNPIPKELDTLQARHIIGAQANIWTEFIPSENRADYCAMPGMTALAEMLWTHRDDYASYTDRLKSHYSRLDRLMVSYRMPDLKGLLDNYVFADKGVLKIEPPLDKTFVRYTRDSSLPGIYSKILEDSLLIDRSGFFRVAAFKQNGTRGDVYDINFEKQSYARPVNAGGGNGLTCSWYKTSFKGTEFIPDNKADGTAKVKGIVVPPEAEAPAFALKYRGYINVPEDDIYSFYLTCDDGAVLRIADRIVVNNDGLHPAKEKSGQAALKRGTHRFALDFVEGGGGYMLKLQYSLNGSAPQDIPAGWLKQ